MDENGAVKVDAHFDFGTNGTMPEDHLSKLREAHLARSIGMQVVEKFPPNITYTDQEEVSSLNVVVMRLHDYERLKERADG